MWIVLDTKIEEDFFSSDFLTVANTYINTVLSWKTRLQVSGYGISGGSGTAQVWDYQTQKDEAAGEAPEMTMRITWMIRVIVQEK